MAERLRVTPVEAAIILVNEVFHSHHSQETAKALHDHSYRMWIHPELDHLRPGDLPPQRATALQDRVNAFIQALQPSDRTKLNPRPSAELLQDMVRMRFGLTDGIIHSYREVGEAFGVTEGYAVTSLFMAMCRFRHPRRISQLHEFLGPQQLTF